MGYPRQQRTSPGILSSGLAIAEMGSSASTDYLYFAIECKTTIGMIVTMRVEKVRCSKQKKEIKMIYTNAFPKEERMPFTMMIAMSYLWNTEFLAYYDGDILCGIMYLATIGRQTFVMFFAVDEKLRSHGYGSRILDCVQKAHPKNKIIISIERGDENTDDIEIKKRRKNFYLRNGYQETGYYLKLGTIQEIIIRNGEFSKLKLRLFFMLYSCLTMYTRIWKDD